MELLAILLTALGVMLAQPHATASSAPARTCFNEQLWSGANQLRPCVRITALHEDGLFDATVENASGDERYRVRIGNRAD
jgi:hypothetical protein